MPTYISLLSYTDQKTRMTTDSPARLDAAKKLLKEMGGELKDFYLTLGPYDFVTVAEAPNEEVVTEFLRSFDSAASVRTTTVKVRLHGRFSPRGPSQLGAIDLSRQPAGVSP